MKNKLIIRKDLNFSVQRLFKVAFSSSEYINELPELLESLHTQELYDLENILINEGVRFEWIMDGKVIVGLLIFNYKENTPNFLKNYKMYTPDIEVSNLEEVKDKWIKSHKN